MIHGGNVWQGEKPSEWLDFSANLRPEGPPDWVKTALAEGMQNARYYPDLRMARAKAALADYLGVDPSCILPTSGGVSAIRMVNLLKSRETLLFTPCFCEYERYAQSPVRKVLLLMPNRTLALPDAHTIAADSIVWLANPMNPVGYAFDAAQIEALLECVEAEGSYLAVDEAFIDYCPEHSAVSLIGHHERLIVTGSFTKILGIPGVRLGYLCAQKSVLKALEKYAVAWELNCFAEAVACALPAHREEICADARENARRREKMTDALRRMGAYVYPSMSACILVDFGRSVKEIAEKLKERKMLVRECADFDGVSDGNHLRLAVKDEASNEKLLGAIKEVMQCAENR